MPVSDAIFWQVASVILTWIVCVAVQWGIFREKIRALEGRIHKIETERFITREEYEGRHNELLGQMKELRGLILNKG